MYHQRLAAFFFITLCFLQTHYLYAANVQSDRAMESQVVQEVNQYRQHRGLKPLVMNQAMSDEARKHSQAMARHSVPFGHSHFLGRIKHLRTEIKNTGGGSENVAYNYKGVQDVVKNWLTSPGHKRNIDGNYQITGVGIARDSRGRLYFTQIFLQTGKNSGRGTQVARVHRRIGSFLPFHF